MKTIELAEGKWKLLLDLLERARQGFFQEDDELYDLSGLEVGVRDELLDRAICHRQVELEEGEEVEPAELPDTLAYLLQEDIQHQLEKQ